jgi:hypothetical protein
MHTVNMLTNRPPREPERGGQRPGDAGVEEHNIYGGLDRPFLEVLQDGHDFPVRIVGVEMA